MITAIKKSGIENKKRREFFITAAYGAGAVGALIRPSAAADESPGLKIGDNTLHVISDGAMHLPVSMVMPDDLIEPALRDEFLKSHSLGPQQLSQDCNITLLQQQDRTIIFDVGAGPNFLPTTGKLYEELDAREIDPLDVTDVVFTHAHPDHLWGLLDDFDEPLFANAQYHLHQKEWEYWLNDNTLSNTPDGRKSFVVGAQNRLPLLEERLSLFDYGKEVLPSVESVDTAGHTPGHTSFAIHGESESVMLLGDALTNQFIAFEQPKWHTAMDQDPALAVTTRLRLLDRLASEQQRIIGYHLPYPGTGMVERKDSAYRYVV
ncbi:MAG: MBL fold metallo-hydrolase [Granulosicoccaceae bacterium]